MAASSGKTPEQKFYDTLGAKPYILWYCVKAFCEPWDKEANGNLTQFVEFVEQAFQNSSAREKWGDDYIWGQDENEILALVNSCSECFVLKKAKNGPSQVINYNRDLYPWVNERFTQAPEFKEVLTMIDDEAAMYLQQCYTNCQAGEVMRQAFVKLHQGKDLDENDMSICRYVVFP